MTKVSLSQTRDDFRCILRQLTIAKTMASRWHSVVGMHSTTALSRESFRKNLRVVVGYFWCLQRNVDRKERMSFGFVERRIGEYLVVGRLPHSTQSSPFCLQCEKRQYRHLLHPMTAFHFCLVLQYRKLKNTAAQEPLCDFQSLETGLACRIGKTDSLKTIKV